MAYGPGDKPGTVRRKPTPPRAVKRARAQEQQYASQGVAVKRAAHKQRQAARVKRLEAALPPTPSKPLPVRRPRVRSVEQAQRASQRKRAKRVQLSAQRKRTGGAAPIIVRRRAKVARGERAQQDLAAALDALTRPREPEPEHDRGVIGDIGHAVSSAAREAAGAAGKGITEATGAIGKGTEKFFTQDIGPLRTPKGGAGAAAAKAAGNIVPDIGELTVTTPSSVAHLASTAVHDPEKLPGLLIEPYRELARDPIGFATEHPVSTALMVTGPARGIGRAGARVARATGVKAPRTEPAPPSTPKQINRRVDELYDYARQRRPQVADAARRQAEDRGYDPEQTATHISGAVAGDLATQFRKEFGENPPDHAVARLMKHQKVGTSKAIGAKVFRVGGRSFRSAVLPASLKWLTGQVIEPGVRAALTGAGPTSLLRERRVYRKLEELEPGAGEAFRQRTSGGGQFGLTGTAREFHEGKSLAEEFPESKIAAGVSRAAAAPGIRHVRHGWHRYSDFVFNGVNGVIERTARRTLTGKAIATSPLMDRHLLTLSDKAITDAAHGLRGSDAQFRLGRKLNDLYGAYSKFSPGQREALLHLTPFAPWYFNSINFLFRVLPRDHPVSTALLADVSALEEQWRKEQGLSLRGGDRRPGFLLGGLPSGEEGAIVRVGRYTPALPADPAQAVADLFLPQFTAPLENLKGLDWKGQRLPGGVVRHIGEAAKSAAEAHVPGAGQVGRALERKGSAWRRVRAEVDPFMATGKPPGGKVRRRQYGTPVTVRVPKVTVRAPRVVVR